MHVFAQTLTAAVTVKSGTRAARAAVRAGRADLGAADTDPSSPEENWTGSRLHVQARTAWNWFTTGGEAWRLYLFTSYIITK